MHLSDSRVRLFRAGLVILSVSTMAACGAGGASSGDAGSTPDAYYTRSSVTMPLYPGCQEKPFVDTNPDMEAVQPNCQVILKVPCNTPGAGACRADGYTENPLVRCIDPATGGPPSPYSSLTAQTQDISDKDRPCWYLLYDRDACPNTFAYQKIAVLEKAGVEPAEGTLLSLSCLICVGGIEVPCPAIDLSH